ncbi:MAG: hypothetical protein H7Y88_00340 [Phycisphaerales bacterium]|nr:hypothetical protein [Phycisphaerales bacterium]
MHRITCRLGALSIACAMAAGAAGQGPQGDGQRERFDGHQVVRVNVRSMDELRVLLAATEDVWSHELGVGEIDARVDAAGIELLKEAGLEARVLIEDVQRLIDAEAAQIAAAGGGGGDEGGLRGPGWFSTYHNHAEISEFVDQLVATRPDLASRFAVGNSLQGREVFGIRLTSGVGGTEKPQILIQSLQHAREWIGGATTMFMADRLLAEYDTNTEVQRLLDGFELLIVPVFNPDGYEHTWTSNRLWRKNRRDNGNGTFGVDTNRNWGYQWGGEGSSGTPGSDTYRGTGPFSEPETQIVRDFIIAHPRLVMHLDVHSYGQYILSPWGYTSALPPDHSLLSALGHGMEGAIEGVHGSSYLPGPGYTTLYASAGIAPDYAYGEHGLLAWTFEVRDTGQFGFVLPASQIVPTGEEIYAGVKWVGDWFLDNQLFLTLSATPTFEPSVPETVGFEVRRGLLLPDLGSAKLLWRVGRSGPFIEAGETDLGNGFFEATITPGVCGSVVQVYLEGAAIGGGMVQFPDGGAAAPIEFSVQTVTVLSDNAESDTGWTLGVAGDTASSGQWVRGNPNGTIAQPENAHSPVTCFFTGQGNPGGGDGAADVDGGFTRLVTPAIELSGQTNATIGYWRWYSNNGGASPGQDVFRVEVSDDGAAWTAVETVGPGGAGTSGGWVYHEFEAGDVVELTSQVRVRFIAEDAGAGSLIEAAIDDMVVRSRACEVCAADVDGNGLVSSADITFFLGAWFADLSSGSLTADFNGDEAVTSADITAFLGAWFGALVEGCGA